MLATAGRRLIDMDLEEAFQHTFNMLLGKGDGEVRLEDLGGYLAQHSRPVSKRKSSVSGKDVALLSDDYCDGAKFVSYDEVRERRFEPLDINEIKDIDSILEAIGDRICYTGNKVLGESGFVEDADVCIDSFYVKGSTNIRQSKYVAYSRMIRDSEFVFGSNTSGKARHMIRTISYNSTRCFEAYYVADTSDTYFSYNCLGCSNNMFSFNQRGTRYAIGNLKLDRDRYFALKSKLLGEIRERIIRDRTFPSIFGFSERTGPLPRIAVEEPNGEKDLGKIEKAFGVTTRILLGKEPGPIGKLGGWLGRHTATVEARKTPFKRETYVPFSSFPFMKEIHESRFVTNEEALELGKLSIKLENEDVLDANSIFPKVGEIAYYSPEIVVGNCRNIIECPLAENSMNIYKVVDANFAKNSALSGQVFSSEYVFGSYWVVDSKFCINCYHSANLSNCFEMDGCSDSRNSMFCHNSENLDHCMFCFNTKSKRYAVGNVEVGREEYMTIKAKIMGGIVLLLEKTGDCGYDIYNVGCRGRS